MHTHDAHKKIFFFHHTPSFTLPYVQSSYYTPNIPPPPILMSILRCRVPALRGLSLHQQEKLLSSERVANKINLCHHMHPPCNSHIILPLPILTTNVMSNGSGNPRLDKFKVEDDKRMRGWHDKRAAQWESMQQPASARQQDSSGVRERQEGSAMRGNATTASEMRQQDGGAVRERGEDKRAAR
jgi:hypothetical protein